MTTNMPQERLRHARGQSLPDWIALRYGVVDTFPEGVAYPETDEHARALFDFARSSGVCLIPYGSDTSVVGHVNPLPGSPPALTVHLSRLNQIHDIDETSRLATVGAGIRGPQLEAALREPGYTLSHFPLSFEYSTLGGWIATARADSSPIITGASKTCSWVGTCKHRLGQWNCRPIRPAQPGQTCVRSSWGAKGVSALSRGPRYTSPRSRRSNASMACSSPTGRPAWRR